MITITGRFSEWARPAGRHFGVLPVFAWGWADEKHAKD